MACTSGHAMMSRCAAVAAMACAVMPEAAAFMASPLPLGAAAQIGAARRAATRPLHALRATAAAPPSVVTGYGDVSNIVLSGLNGKAFKDKEFPSKREVEAEGTWVRDDKVRCSTSLLVAHANSRVHARRTGCVRACTQATVLGRVRR